MAEQNEVTYTTGAKRSAQNPRYRDIDIGFLKRTANAFSEGVPKYEANMLPFQKNWKNGDLTFALDVLDHAIEHLYAYKEYVLRSLNRDDTSEFDGEDHLGHLGANCVMLDYFEKRGFWEPNNYEPDETFGTDAGPIPETGFEEPIKKTISETISDFFRGKATKP